MNRSSCHQSYQKEPVFLTMLRREDHMKKPKLNFSDKINAPHISASSKFNLVLPSSSKSCIAWKYFHLVKPSIDKPLPTKLNSEKEYAVCNICAKFIVIKSGKQFTTRGISSHMKSHGIVKENPTPRSKHHQIFHQLYLSHVPILIHQNKTSKTKSMS